MASFVSGLLSPVLAWWRFIGVIPMLVYVGVGLMCLMCLLVLLQFIRLFFGAKMTSVHKIVLAELVAIVVLTVLSAFGIAKPASTVQVTLIGAAAQDVQITIYGADWCTPCRSYLRSIKPMAKDGWIQKDVTDKDASTAHILIDKRPESITQFAIEKLPCTVFRLKGKEVKRVYGAMTPDELAKTFNELGKGTQ